MPHSYNKGRRELKPLTFSTNFRDINYVLYKFDELSSVCILKLNAITVA